MFFTTKEAWIGVLIGIVVSIIAGILTVPRLPKDPRPEMRRR